MISNKKKVLIGVIAWLILVMVGIVGYLLWLTGDSPYTVREVNNGTHIIIIKKIVHARDISWMGLYDLIAWMLGWAAIIAIAVAFSIDWDD